MSDPQKKKTSSPLIKSNALYDTLKHFTMVVLPAMGTLYFGLSQLWHLPHGGEVVGTITTIVTFFGVVLHISNAQYQNSDASVDGTMNVTETEDKKLLDLQLHGDPNDLDKQDKVTFKVNKTTKS